jgi:hypothetical protein
MVSPRSDFYGDIAAQDTERAQRQNDEWCKLDHFTTAIKSAKISMPPIIIVNAI